jgi:hypothetical protein
MKIEKFQLRSNNSVCITATIQCASEHFGYCAATQPHSLEGTLAACQNLRRKHRFITITVS